MAVGFQGSFSDQVQRDHEGHLEMGSFSDTSCPMCSELVSLHASHIQGSFAEGVARDEEGHLKKGSFADSDCPICRAGAAKAN